MRLGLRQSLVGHCKGFSWPLCSTPHPHPCELPGTTYCTRAGCKESAQYQDGNEWWFLSSQPGQGFFHRHYAQLGSSSPFGQEHSILELSQVGLSCTSLSQARVGQWVGAMAG